MKFKIIFIVISLLSTNLFSQENAFRLLLSAGANASQVNGDKLGGFDKFGLNAGLGLQRVLSSKSSVQIDFLYSEKGSKDVVTNNNPVPDTLFQFNYIDIPIVYSYEFYPKLRAEIGIYNSVLLKAEYSDFVITYDRSGVIRKTDHGVIGGLNYQFLDHWSVNARVSQSIFDINATIERYFNLTSSISIRYSIGKF